MTVSFAVEQVYSKLYKNLSYPDNIISGIKPIINFCNYRDSRTFRKYLYIFKYIFKVSKNIWATISTNLIYYYCKGFLLELLPITLVIL